MHCPPASNHEFSETSKSVHKKLPEQILVKTHLDTRPSATRLTSRQRSHNPPAGNIMNLSYSIVVASSAGKAYADDIQPHLLRTPEVILNIPWNVGVMVSWLVAQPNSRYAIPELTDVRCQ